MMGHGGIQLQLPVSSAMLRSWSSLRVAFWRESSFCGQESLSHGYTRSHVVPHFGVMVTDDESVLLMESKKGDVVAGGIPCP